MAFLKVKNRAVSTLAANITDVATSLTVATGEGAKFPTTGDFHITIEDEILRCTARTDDVLTVVRAQEGTSAAAHVADETVSLNITAEIVARLQKELWDADGDTGIQVEEAADEDKIRLDVAGVEAFVLTNLGILKLPKQSSARVSMSGSQAISDVTYTKLNMDVEGWDTQNEYDTTNKRFTCTETGIYFIMLWQTYATFPANKQFMACIYKNGSLLDRGDIISPNVAAYGGPKFATAISVTAGDYLEHWAYQNTGASQTMYGGDSMRAAWLILKMS